MKMIDLRLLLLAAAVAICLCRSAHAEVVHLTLQPGSQVELTISVDSPLSDPSDVDVSLLTGTIDIDLGRSGQTTPMSMSILQADVDASDVAFRLNFGFLVGVIDADVTGAHFSADTPGAPPDPPVDPASGQFLLSDHRLVLDGGFAQYQGSGLLLGNVSDSYDFGVLPEEFSPPPGFTGTIEIEPTQINQYLVTLTIPIDSVVHVDTIVIGAVTADLSLRARGSIVATGLIGLIAAPAGDLNGDSVANNLDIAPFALALSDPAAFVQQFPQVDPLAVGDFNRDGLFNNLDIAPFAAFLSGGPANGGLAASVPEPATVWLGALGALLGYAYSLVRPCRSMLARYNPWLVTLRWGRSSIG